MSTNNSPAALAPQKGDDQLLLWIGLGIGGLVLLIIVILLVGRAARRRQARRVAATVQPHIIAGAPPGYR